MEQRESAFRRRPAWSMLVVSGMLAASALFATPAAADVGIAGSACNAVDGGELVYDDFTKYNDSLNHAVNQWNALNPIDVRADDAWSYSDVDVSDSNDGGNGTVAYYSCVAGADDIVMNTHYLDSYSTSRDHAAMTHEFGHAIGLDHGPEVAVMDPYSTDYNPNMNNNLQSWDISTYHSKWGY
ncbi:M57 family metalloprotease [Micromonospora sp. DSM 115977]|uniref:M57 family metalloprotease n=1 Tax=Micromonospora reichwaldensis TaxID=3075516 RepID=A0ABU2WX55_9ACTN|nr:M57 family metalloprotease [Micromonospora sp. DSM 115977]MDT0529642.1 M57 family metalloprotease [Micromonospora sp. DSM 115977]